MKIILILKNILNSRTFYLVYFGFLGLLSFIIAISSLKWIIGLDLQPVLYSAFLTDKFHYLPYKDFLYFNFPFVHLFFFILVKIFGYNYFWIRIADLIYLTLTLLVSFFILKKISLKAALCGIITVSLIYFAGQNYFSLQRDFILLLPVFLSVLIFSSRPGEKTGLKSFLMGFLCACAFLIKPQAIIVFPVFLFFNLLFNYPENSKIFSIKNILKTTSISGLGFAIPVIVTLIYLLVTGSFNSFMDILTNFMPFYRNSNVAIVTDPSIHVENIFIRNIKMGGYRPFLIPAAAGFYFSVFRSALNRHQKLLIYLLAVLCIAFIIYDFIGTKIMNYYWIPFAVSAIFLSSTCFVEQKQTSNKFEQLLKLLALLSVFVIFTLQIIIRPESRNFFVKTIEGKLNGNDASNQLYPDIVSAADYLKNNSKEGDKALTLDDVGNGLHSMMLAEFQPATYYLYCEGYLAFGEIEYPGNEYLLRMHRDYMEKFNSSKPKFVIDFSGEKHFDDLIQILDKDYFQVKLKHGIIYQRKE